VRCNSYPGIQVGLSTWPGIVSNTILPSGYSWIPQCLDVTLQHCRLTPMMLIRMVEFPGGGSTI